ncbi:MAG: hypothetical protein V1806_17055 [Pseudomonadota bacterium]
MRKLTCLWVWLALAGLWVAPAAAQGDPLALLDQARGSLQVGQKLEALGLLDQAGRALWNQLGLGVANAVLTREEAQGFGMYNPREGNLYSNQEPILVYLEPRGYRVTTPQPGLFAFGVRVDVSLLATNGEVLWGKENALVKNILSRRFNREFYITLTLNFKGAPAGDYVVLLTLHDQQSPTPVQVRLPIRFKS